MTATKPAYSASVRLNHYFGSGYSNQPYTSAHIEADTLEELVRDLAGRFPLHVCKVVLDMHNGGGLDIRASIRESGETPRDRVTHSVNLDVYLACADGITDRLWADLARVLAPACGEVVAGRAPSSRFWSQGCNGSGRSTAEDAEAIAEVERMMSAPLFLVEYSRKNAAGINGRATAPIWAANEGDARDAFRAANPDRVVMGVSLRTAR